jgi:hypothetical protein
MGGIVIASTTMRVPVAVVAERHGVLLLVPSALSYLRSMVDAEEVVLARIRRAALGAVGVSETIGLSTV